MDQEHMKKVSGRALKQKVLHLLTSEDLPLAMNHVGQLPARQVVNPLFSLFHARDEWTRWGAVMAMGLVVTRLADQDMEAARIVMRRLMWNLNDESGGIGWGSPEAMGEILSRHEGLAKEYAPILLSYAREDGNYLEHPMLQRGLLWGIGRLAQARQEKVRGEGPHLFAYLESSDPGVRGHGAWVAGLLHWEKSRPLLEKLMGDDKEFSFFTGSELTIPRVSDMAREALSRLSV
jgi:hypothetical protein